MAARSYTHRTDTTCCIQRLGFRGADALALENASEGRVRQTYGALFATWMANTATDVNVREAMTRVASDELDHALLARAVTRWLEPRLGHKARRATERARGAALEALRRELSTTPSYALTAVAGLPTSAQALVLLDHTSDALLNNC